MAEKKKIPCRVCGKPFEPCSICQSDNTMFRWRNFACSKECAEKYMSDTIAYRESLKHKGEKSSVLVETENADTEVSTKKNTTTKKKNNNRSLTDLVETEIENNKTE